MFPKEAPPEGSEQKHYNCELCWDTGMELLGRLGARKCTCRIVRTRDKLLAKIPPRFRDVRLEYLVPDKERHRKQATLFAFAKANPEVNYFLAGDAGTGKTMLMWALYAYAVELGKRVVRAITLAELLDQYRAFIRDSIAGATPKFPLIGAEDLRSSDRKYAIFLDDIDKAKPTEYAAEETFKLVNAIYEEEHQLVVTTNKPSWSLIRHFNRADEDYGEPIIRRMLEGAKEFEMFNEE